MKNKTVKRRNTKKQVTFLRVTEEVKAKYNKLLKVSAVLFFEQSGLVEGGWKEMNFK